MTQNIQADILTIGDEILIGQIVDSNSAYISRALNRAGIRIRKKYSLGDSETAIREALNEAIGKVSLLIFTGGLGPTKDDITKITLNNYFGGKLVKNEKVYTMLHDFFTLAGREFSEANQGQALVPDVCAILPNTRGTAPGMVFEKNGTVVISLPGVPYEMEGLMEDEVMPFVEKRFQLPPVLHKTILTQGLPESVLMERIKDWENALDSRVKLAYLPSPGLVRLRLTVIENFEGAENYLNQKAAELHPILPDRIYGYDTDTMEEVVMRLLQKNKATVSFAESCTGGYLAHRLTSIPGSSKVFNGSVVTYGYDAKSKILGASKEVLEKEGAVSETIVIQMSEGVKKLYRSEYAISTSGIAGPDGGTPDKPVGTVWIAVSGPGGTRAKKFRFMGNRTRNIQMTFMTGFNLLRLMLEEE
ncbi:MAG: competence/damage-inducible protein A [Flavobacteriales bacterium]|nr:competence/damage-inducible protein A [Flavobacteriales bacterium]